MLGPLALRARSFDALKIAARRAVAGQNDIDLIFEL